MGSKFFGIEKREKKKKEVKKEETYDANFFTSGQGFDPSVQTNAPVEDNNQVNNEGTTFAYAAPSGFDPSKIGAPDEKNYISNEEMEAMQKGEVVSEQNIEEVKEEPPKKEKKGLFGKKEKKDLKKENVAPPKEEEPKTVQPSSPEAPKEEEKFNPFVAAGEIEPEYANPVYVEEEKKVVKEDIKVNIFSTIKLMIGAIFKPVTSIPKNAKSIEDLNKAIKFLVYFVVILLALSIGVAILTSGFVKKYDINTGLYSTYMDFGNIINVKFIDVIIKTISFSLLFTLIVAFIYYITSFFRNKGVAVGTYIVLSSLSLLPLYLGIFVLYPVLSIFSYFLGFFAFTISLVFSLFSLYNAIVSMLEFQSEDKKIFYNLFNIGIVIFLLILIVAFFFQNDFNSIINLVNEI